MNPWTDGVGGGCGGDGDYQTNSCLDFDSMNPATPLVAASRLGDSRAVKGLLTSGAQPNTNDNRGWTCLHEAAAHGHDEVVRVLLSDERVDVDVTTYTVETPLMIAAQKKYGGVAEVLLEKGADVNFSNASGRTPLILAAECGSQEVIKILLSFGAEVNQAYFSGWTPLHFASHEGRANAVSILLAHPEVDVKFADKDGLTPLFLATQRGSVEVVKMLLEKAREQTILDQVVNARATDGTGISPVFLAAQEGHMEIVELLVEAGALVDTYFINDACYEESPIDLARYCLPIQPAIEKCHLDVVRYLAQKMNWETFHTSYPTPFHFCVMWNNPECLEVLLTSAPPSIDMSVLLMPDLVDAEGVLISSNFRVNLGYTHLDVLGTAVYFENVTMVRRLLELGLNPNPVLPKVFPPLLLALVNSSKSLALTKTLLEFGADPNIYHSEVKGNLALLSCLDDQLLMTTLISFGADVDSFFHPQPIQPFIYQFSKNENESTSSEPALSLLRIMEGNGQAELTPLSASSKRRFKLLKFLLPLVFTVPMIEYAKYKKLLRGADWNCLQSWTKWPPTLAQLCRRQIKQRISTSNWSGVNADKNVDVDLALEQRLPDKRLEQRFSYREKVEQLHLPQFLASFLTHADDVKALEEEKEAATERVGRSFVVDESFGVPGMELDLEAMD